MSTALTRRAFLRSTAAAGAAAGITPLFPASPEARKPGRQTSRRTLFFNLSHEADCHTATYFVWAAGRRYPLTPVHEHPDVLARERQANRFLSGVPDAALTHFVAGFAAPTNTVTISYIVKNPDTGSGTWSMSALFINLPKTAVLNAYQQACHALSAAPRPLSAKRRMYGHAAALSADDFLEEEALKDASDHATTLIALHPEVLSAEPNSAAHIQHNHIATNGGTTALRIQLQQLGDAQPQQQSGLPNSSGWATLTPFTDNGRPLRNQKGENAGLIEYNPEWHPVVQQLAGLVIRDAVQRVKDDPCLGADVTDALNDGPRPPLTGTVWHRRDGIPTVVQQGLAAASQDVGTLKYAFVASSPQNGYGCTASVTASGNDVNVQLSFENWYLRWLGLWVQFRDANDNVVPVSDKILAGFPQGILHTDTEVFLGFMSPEWTLFGVPLQSSKTTAAFKFPTDVASSAKILASGLGTGSEIYPDTEDFGVIMTTFFCLLAPPVLIALGAAQNIDPWQRLLIALVKPSLTELFALIGDLHGDIGYKNLAVIFGKAIVNVGAPILLKYVGTVIAEAVLGSAEDAVPIVGQVVQAIGALGAAAELTETVAEVALSPWTYEYDLTLTHDLTATIKCDPNDDTTPKAANQYKVTALFDKGGTPVVQVVDLPQPVKDVTVRFTGVPLGGQVNVSASFYQTPAHPGDPHILLGKASSGLVSNAVDTLDAFDITELKYSIGSTTVYRHKQKTVLDSNGHSWALAAAPTTKASDVSCEQAPGTLCNFRGITVRQGTSQARGYLGYAWQGYSTGVGDCISGAQGQLDQLANLGTGEDPQSGYANAACGLQAGARLVYSLLSHASANFYLDSTSKVIRRVQLDPSPQFDDPRSKQAWGKFNLDSDALLLHPTGLLVSINGANHKIETLKIPPAPMSDADAAVHLLAQVHAGRGSRPGLISSPAAAAISADGVILVLERDNHRIQAFDTGANPVPFFKNQKKPDAMYFLNLTATASGNTVYLDLAVEFTNYLYVLSYNETSNVYRLDIYHPDQSDTHPISTTTDVNAAKLTVDFWRNVYTLNYEVLQSSQGIAEPSVSLWVPTGV